MTDIEIKKNNIWASERESLSWGVQKTNAQTSLRISVDWSAPFSFAFWEVSFLELLQVKFQFSS